MVGYFARINKKKKSMPASSAAINVCFLAVIDSKPNLNAENECFLETKKNLL